jgi:hypothetical protein
MRASYHQKGSTLAAVTRASILELPCPQTFGAGDDEIVEWRAMTVALLDVLHTKILARMDGVTKVQDRTTLCLWTFSRCKLTTRFPRARLQHLR